MESSGKSADARHEFASLEGVSEDVKVKLFFAMAENGWPITEIKPSIMTLEDIFISVVTKGQEVR